VLVKILAHVPSMVLDRKLGDEKEVEKMTLEKLLNKSNPR
jgi:hypothetical protein